MVFFSFVHLFRRIFTNGGAAQPDTDDEQINQKSFPVFSDEITTEILLRLPVESLIRFRLVCKEWNVMCTTSIFVTKHYYHQAVLTPQPSVYWPRLSFGSKSDRGMGRRGEPWIEMLSEEPRAFLYHNFLAKEECEHLINLARPCMVKSKVFDNENEVVIDISVRTSSETRFEIGQDKVIKNIEKRIVDYTSIPVDYGEELQVLHYEVGEKFVPHFDYFRHYKIDIRYQKMVTLIMYLSDVEEGGETVFPYAEGNFDSEGLVVKPKLGDALLFWSIHPNGTLDLRSLHESRPVMRGNKWIATKWMHVCNVN